MWMFYIQLNNKKMKRLILIFGMVLIVGALSAQISNSFKYVIKAKGGITNTLKGLDADKIDSAKVSGGAVKFYQGATQLIPDIPAAGYDDIYDYVARKYLTDTLLITDAGYTLVLADAGRYIRTYHATSVNIIVPPNTDVALPVGTVINFVSTLGSINFVTGSGVTFNSELDSLNVANKGGGATLVKRATDKWDLVGSLLN